MNNNINVGDVVEYFGTRFLVEAITNKDLICLSGYDFNLKVISKNVVAGFRKVKDVSETTRCIVSDAAPIEEYEN